jgi:hypothetical protein
LVRHRVLHTRQVRAQAPALQAGSGSRVPGLHVSLSPVGRRCDLPPGRDVDALAVRTQQHTTRDTRTSPLALTRFRARAAACRCAGVAARLAACRAAAARAGAAVRLALGGRSRPRNDARTRTFLALRVQPAALAGAQRAVAAALAAHGLPCAADAHASSHVTVAWAWGDHVSHLRELLRLLRSGGAGPAPRGACWRARVADVRLRVGDATSLVVW